MKTHIEEHLKYQPNKVKIVDKYEVIGSLQSIKEWHLKNLDINGILYNVRYETTKYSYRTQYSIGFRVLQVLGE